MNGNSIQTPILRDVNLPGGVRALLELLLRDESRLPGGVTDDHPPLLHALDVALEVAPDAIAHGNERELGVVEEVPVLGRELDHAQGKAVVVLLLLHGVVEGAVAEVLLSIGWDAADWGLIYANEVSFSATREWIKKGSD